MHEARAGTRCTRCASSVLPSISIDFSGLQKDRRPSRLDNGSFVASVNPEDIMENVLVSPNALTTSDSRAPVWIGRVLTGLIATFLLVDATAKLIPLAVVVEGTTKLGFAVEVIRPLGVVIFVSTLLHLIRRTELVGAVLVTAFLGGATATHVHVGTPFWFPVAMGVLLWIAYYLRRPQLRALLLSTSARTR